MFLILCFLYNIYQELLKKKLQLERWCKIYILHKQSETYHWLAKFCEKAPFYVHCWPIIKIFRKMLHAASGSISGQKKWLQMAVVLTPNGSSFDSERQ